MTMDQKKWTMFVLLVREIRAEAQMLDREDMKKANYLVSATYALMTKSLGHEEALRVIESVDLQDPT